MCVLVNSFMVFAQRKPMSTSERREALMTQCDFCCWPWLQKSRMFRQYTFWNSRPTHSGLVSACWLYSWILKIYTIFHSLCNCLRNFLLSSRRISSSSKFPTCTNTILCKPRGLVFPELWPLDASRVEFFLGFLLLWEGRCKGWGEEKQDGIF